MPRKHSLVNHLMDTPPSTTPPPPLLYSCTPGCIEEKAGCADNRAGGELRSDPLSVGVHQCKFRRAAYWTVPAQAYFGRGYARSTVSDRQPGRRVRRRASEALTLLESQAESDRPRAAAGPAGRVTARVTTGSDPGTRNRSRSGRASPFVRIRRVGGTPHPRLRRALQAAA